MLKIRLRRTGARKRPNYRVVVAEATAPRDGQFIEIIGFYDPLTDPATVRIDGDKAKDWLKKGAQPTERVARLFGREGIIAMPPVPATPPKPKPEPAPAASAPPPAQPAVGSAAAEAAPEPTADAASEPAAESAAEPVAEAAEPTPDAVAEPADKSSA